MTDAVVVSLAVFGLASVLAERDVAVVSGRGLIFFERALVAAPVVFAVAVFGLASVLVEHAVAVVSGLGLIFAARAPAAAVGFVSAFGLAAVVAEHAVASGLGLIFAARAPAAVVVFSVVVAVFVLVVFLADRAFALFALPALVAVRWSVCSFPPMRGC